MSSVTGGDMGSPPSRRRRLNDGASADPYVQALAGPSQDESYYHLGNGNGVPHGDEDEGESSYNDEYADCYAACASQTDNPNTPIGLHHTLSGDGGLRLRPSKSIQDRVHGQILLHGLLVAVMDTAEFQRLDRVRQLGGCYFVYPSATHTRKEHSMGVAHLAGFMARHLMKTQPELEIDDADVLCIELAGLVHDLGHGPFSHMFEHFMEQVDARMPDEERPDKWEHEIMSARLLRRLIERNGVPVADYFGALDGARGCDAMQAECHINFVVRLVEGLKDDDPWPTDIGRPPQKRFLFDIVSNKRNGVDVDKLDYLVRDSMAAFGCSSSMPGFDIYRIISSSIVLYRKNQREQPEVCFQVKNALEILEIYSLRAKLHRQVYQHRIANVTEAMITDVFLAASEAFRVKGGPESKATHPEGLRIAEAARDCDAFVRLNDSILDALDLSTSDGLGTAHALLGRLKARDFYQQVGQQVNIETLPTCANPHCRHGTPIDARYCERCGQSTVTRAHTVRKKTGVYESPGTTLTEGGIKAKLLEKMGNSQVRREIEAADALFVTIVDIQVGKSSTKTDPHGIQWATYDPLARVGFHNPRNPLKKPIELDSAKFPQIYLPKAAHTRTLWCYLRTEEAGWRAEVEKALDDWKADLGLTEQHGTSNTASPAAHLAAHRAGATPRGGAPGSRGRANMHQPVSFLNGNGNRRLSAISEGPTVEAAGAHAA